MKKTFLTLMALLCAVASMAQQDENPWKLGAGQFVYTGYAPLADKPVTVYYYIPLKGDVRTMPVLMAMHGAERNGQPNITIWRDFADADSFIVISPQFSRDIYSVNDYQYGGIYTDSTYTTLRPREEWTYSLIEALFDYFKECTGNQSEKYSMWGHSAGGQFVHRYMLAMPDARVRIGVASNPGTWTFPCLDGLKDKEGNVYGWPYSVKNSPFEDADYIRAFMSRPLIVHSGNADTATSGKHVPTYAAALAEGRDRYDRGKNFYKTAREEAKKLKCKLRWRMVTVDDVGHAGRSMVYGTKKTVNGQSVFDIDYITHTGAYYLIYGKGVE